MLLFANVLPAVRLERFEHSFIRLLHLLAHHPDFRVEQEYLPDIAKYTNSSSCSLLILTLHLNRYIQFFLDLVATSDNIALLYHIALKSKTVRDAESHSYSEVSGDQTFFLMPFHANKTIIEPIYMRGVGAIHHQSSREGTLMESRDVAGQSSVATRHLETATQLRGSQRSTSRVQSEWDVC